ncbi:hypothetical protein ACROYT_G043362 [Oculina patagonica]
MLRTNVTMAAATEGTATESSFSEEEVSKLMGQGKRHLICSEVVQAVKCFEEATQKLDGKYGSQADECGEAYLFYGKALLELARAENGVLGNAIKEDLDPKSGESDDDDEEQMEAEGPKISEMSPKTKDKIREDVQDAMAEEDKSAEKDKEGKDQDKNKEDKQDKDSRGEEKEEGEKESEKEEKESKEGEEGGKAGKEKGNEAEEGAKEGKEEGKGGEEEEEEGEDEEMEGEEGEDEGEGTADDQGEGDAAATAEGQEEDADIPTMQLAWETLELARIVFSRQDTKEAQLNLAEVYLKLGEIELEQEQFVDAAGEFQKCLDLQLKHLEPDDRLIAETAYNMGLAYSLQPNYSKAKEFFSKALDVIKLKTTKLEARIAESESKSKGKGKATDDNPCVVDRKELEELQNLYPEIKARVDDAQEMMNSASNQPESTTEEGFGSSGQGKSDVPASTIPVKQPATLIPIRRKRKPEEESSSTAAQDTEAPIKKARQEDDQPAAPVVTENGHVPNGGVTTEQK